MEASELQVWVALLTFWWWRESAPFIAGVYIIHIQLGVYKSAFTTKTSIIKWIGNMYMAGCYPTASNKLIGIYLLSGVGSGCARPVAGRVIEVTCWSLRWPVLWLAGRGLGLLRAGGGERALVRSVIQPVRLRRDSTVAVQWRWPSADR